VSVAVRRLRRSAQGPLLPVKVSEQNASPGCPWTKTAIVAITHRQRVIDRHSRAASENSATLFGCVGLLSADLPEDLPASIPRTNPAFAAVHSHQNSFTPDIPGPSAVDGFASLLGNDQIAAGRVPERFARTAKCEDSETGWDTRSLASRQKPTRRRPCRW